MIEDRITSPCYFYLWRLFVTVLFCVHHRRDGVNAPSSDIKTRPVLALMQYGGEQYTLFAIASQIPKIDKESEIKKWGLCCFIYKMSETTYTIQVLWFVHLCSLIKNTFLYLRWKTNKLFDVVRKTNVQHNRVCAASIGT